MFVHDAPFSVDFPKTHRESEFQRFPFAGAIYVDAPSFCCGESDVGACCDFSVFETECDGFFYVREEELPGGHVGIDTAGLKRRRDIEHQNVRVVIGADGRQVFSSNGFGPLIDECTYLLHVGTE